MENSLNGKQVKIIYDDGHEMPIPKKGVVQNSDSYFIFIVNEKKEIEGLSKSRIIRIEVYDKNN